MPNRQKKFHLSPQMSLGVGRGYSQNKILKYSTAICLVLASILAFNAFRLIFSGKGSTVALGDSSTPQVLGASDIRPQTQQDTIQFIEYKIQKGDTLFNVSQKFNMNWTTLATLNNLKSPFYLKPGTTIKVPNTK